MNRTKNEVVKSKYSVINALRRIDTSTILFFLGILIAIAALQSTGMLMKLAVTMTHAIGNESIIVIIIGLISSIIDNVPLVAAAQGMYDLGQFPQASLFLGILAYCRRNRR